MSRVALLGVALLALSPVMAAAQPMRPALGLRAAPQGFQMKDVLDRLSPQGQQIFRDNWLAIEHQENPQRKAAAQAAEQNVLAVMAAEPFNAGALRRAYADQRAVTEANQKQREEHLVDVLKRLSPADRHLVVDQLNAMRARLPQGLKQAQ